MLYPTSSISNTALAYLPKLKNSGYLVYVTLLLGIGAAIAALPFVYTDISVRTNGITRPMIERTDVKPVIGGIIDTVLYREGDRVEKNATILRLRDPNTKGKKVLNEYEIRLREQMVADLNLLTNGHNLAESDLAKLRSPLYREQLSRFLHQRADQEASLAKANKEVEMNTPLAKEKVISPKEFFDVEINQQKIQSSYKAFLQEQLSNWQQDLTRLSQELSQYRQQLDEVNADAAYFEVRAPISGVIQGINTRYTGGLLQANETLCSISPEGVLIGECYIQTKDVGLLKLGQPARFQIEAFDYKYFGSLTGRIISIDNDFTVVNGSPYIKVRCGFDETALHLKNGFTGKIKKGLNFQARFMVARRSLWQLLFDKLDDWLNPNAPQTSTTSSK